MIRPFPFLQTLVNSRQISRIFTKYHKATSSPSSLDMKSQNETWITTVKSVRSGIFMLFTGTSTPSCGNSVNSNYRVSGEAVTAERELRLSLFSACTGAVIPSPEAVLREVPVSRELPQAIPVKQLQSTSAHLRSITCSGSSKNVKNSALSVKRCKNSCFPSGFGIILHDIRHLLNDHETFELTSA